ncbi:hypothetical protein AD942_11080 [Gluconobacter japonicus]|uniref:hypothetical protein n=1 Tax=Gluconobacter japonicus TaxID=376620 RepID=UPI000785775F|nr:hypothetical protein [Gluconobacter japonicus]KXV23868.1 hypothetical protein AD936_21035 [Gluconobacter japonicus]KXV39292.1 hypothetical protein AD942_11080 [Gluconobacter japonicus]
MSQNTEQNVRTREEQAEALAYQVFTGIMGATKKRHEFAVAHILEAEARGAAEERRKSFLQKVADASEHLENRPDIQAWQESRSEFFDAQILEIVTEYAAWRDRKDAGEQEPVMWQKQLLDGTWSWSTCHAAHEANGTPTRALYTRPANVAALEARVKALEGVLQKADEFVTNGIEFGYIRMPDADTPDTALATPGIIRAALTREGGV